MTIARSFGQHVRRQRRASPHARANRITTMTIPPVPQSARLCAAARPPGLRVAAAGAGCRRAAGHHAQHANEGQPVDFAGACRRRRARFAARVADTGGQGAHLQGHGRARARPAAGRRPAAAGCAGPGERQQHRDELGRRRSARGDPQRPRGHARRGLHDRWFGRGHRDAAHHGGHSARGAAGDARNAAADERRRDDQGGRHLQDPATGGARARQHHAAARQLAARAAAGLFSADRPAALHRRARNDAHPRALREGRERGAPR